MIVCSGVIDNGWNNMKTIAFCNFHDFLNRDNFMFEHADSLIGDDLLRPFLELKKYALKQNVRVATVDVVEVADADAVVFVDMPDTDNPYFTACLAKKIPIYLIMLESKIVRKNNYVPDNHRCFTKIFTYDDSLVDNVKYFKINYAFSFPVTIEKDLARKKKLCTLIAGNKKVRHQLSLYGEREKAIRWFEEHHPDDFEFYGVGWDEYVFPDIRFLKNLNRLKLLKKILAPSIPSYRGRVVRKRDVLGAYRFAICYENVKNIPGYITEKIFDCFFAGTVPVYLGANNISQHIPSACFVDRREYGSYEELFDFLNTMSDETYLRYLENIEAFLKSEKSYPFTCDCFAKTIIDGIISATMKD